MGFSRAQYWSGLPFPPPGELPNPLTDLVSPTYSISSILIAVSRTKTMRIGFSVTGMKRGFVFTYFSFLRTSTPYKTPSFLLQMMLDAEHMGRRMKFGEKAKRKHSSPRVVTHSPVRHRGHRSSSSFLSACQSVCLLLAVQWLGRVRLFAAPWTAAPQASLSITSSWSSLKPMSIESVMPSNHLILCRPLLLPPSIFPSIGVYSNESVLRNKWPKY